MVGDGDRDNDGLPGGEPVGAGVAGPGDPGESVGACVAGPGDAGETGPVTGEAKTGDAGRSSSIRAGAERVTGVRTPDPAWPMQGEEGSGST